MLKEPATHTKRGRVTAYGFSEGFREETVDGRFALYTYMDRYIVREGGDCCSFTTLAEARSHYDNLRNTECAS